MTHTSHYCGCDADHTPMHTRGENGCKHRTDPKEVLIRDTEDFLTAEGPTMPAPSSLLQRWLDIS